MPNPFMRLGSPNMGKTPPDRERPTGAIDPVPERVAGAVFAYRGQETHGVPTDRSAVGSDPDEYDNASRYDIHYAEPEPEPEPIPVRIVDHNARELVYGRFSRSSATGSLKGGGATQLVGNDYANRTRRLARIRNLSTDWVWISHERETATAEHGYKLLGGDVFESHSHDAIWAKGTVPEESPMGVYVEWSIAVTHD